MKFTKPINRELDIDGNTFIVSFDDRGIEFRVKGKRKTAHVAWNKVIEMAQGEDGSSASQLFGFSAQSEPERQEQANAPQTLRDDQFTGNHPSPDSLVAEPQSSEPQSSEPQSNNEPSDTPDEVGRAVTAGEKGPEY